MRKLFMLALLALSFLSVGNANAAHVGVVVGVPLWGHGYYGPAYYPPAYYPPAYYPPPTYYSPPPVYVQSAPPVYVQQNTDANNYWYYCKESKSYYPYAQTCPSNWMKVIPNGPTGEQAPPK